MVGLLSPLQVTTIPDANGELSYEIMHKIKTLNSNQ